MKRWGLLVAAAYAATLTVLLFPLAALCFGNDADGWEILTDGLGWSVIVVLAVDQFILLLVPIDLSVGRPVSRRKLWLPVILSASFLTLIASGTVLSAFMGIWGDKSPEGPMLAALGVTGFSWFAWGWIFHRYAETRDPADAVNRMMKWLLGGSILELLVAVPCHIAARKREECCAPGVTFLGICTGIAVMLLSFGPGVLYLFARRLRERRPVSAPPASTADGNPRP